MQVWIYVGFQTGISNILSPSSGMPFTREPGISGLGHFVFLHVSLFSLHPLHTYVHTFIKHAQWGSGPYPFPHAHPLWLWAGYGYGFTTVPLPQNLHNDLWYWKKRSLPLMEGYSAYTYVYCMMSHSAQTPVRPLQLMGMELLRAPLWRQESSLGVGR